MNISTRVAGWLTGCALAMSTLVMVPSAAHAAYEEIWVAGRNESECVSKLGTAYRHYKARYASTRINNPCSGPRRTTGEPIIWRGSIVHL